MAILLCCIALWRVFMMALLGASLYAISAYVLESAVTAISLDEPVRQELLPDVILLIRATSIGLGVLCIAAPVIAVCSAYNTYQTLYPRFLRGGTDAAALYWFCTKHHGGCPEAGFHVAAFLAEWEQKRAAVRA